MSRGYKRKRKIGVGGIVLIIIILSMAKEVLPGLLVGALSITGVGLIFVGIMALLVFIIKRLVGNNYAEPNKGAANKNPYSVNYDKSRAESEAAAALKKQEEARKAEAKKAEAMKAEEEAKAKAAKAEPKHRTTGDPEIDKMIVDMDLAIDEMKRLDDAIEDEKLSQQIVHLEEITKKIVDYIITHPNKKKEVNKFFTYYLPTTLKLLNAYDRMDDVGISGANIDGTKGKVEDMMETALAAFDKQLDALFADEALDVTTDIAVMENMLKAEGLTEDSITLSL